MQSDELGHCIRAWRDRLDPAAVGLAAGPRRRAPGLRREEPTDLHAAAAAYPADERLAEALARLSELVLEGAPG